MGAAPAVNGVPVNAASAPLLRSMVKAASVVELGLLLVTYANLPVGSAASENGNINVPPANGEPATGVSPPELESTVKPEIVPPAESTAYKNFPAGSTVTVGGLEPAANGEPDTLANAPVAASMPNAETLFPPKFATYANFAV